MLNYKALGGILLIVGTSIGAGMLALPLALSAVGFQISVLLLVLCWLVMYLGARFLLEVNLKHPPGTHIVTMAKQTLGWPGQILAWVTCLCLLYSLLSGYVAGGNDIFKNIFIQIGIITPDWMGTILFTGIFSLVVYAGIHLVDYVNRGLMFGKLGIYALLIFMLFPSIHLSSLHGGESHAITASLMILITSFGFASIVPSLCYYFDNDAIILRRVLFWGSVLPLFCYIVWNGVMMGVIPRTGEQGLIALSHSTYPLGGLIQSLEQQVDRGIFSRCFNLFTIICILTAFLGVSLGLFDFLADGLSLKKKGAQGGLIYLVTFLPPVIIVLLYPGIYLSALRYAGRCCVILLVLLPALMAWKEYQKANFTVPGGRVSLIAVSLFALLLLYIG